MAGTALRIILFLSILVARLLSAFYSNISDCDEVFNYWEPLHYLLHGKGFQTWEYSPEYGIRSYAYIALHAILLLPFKVFGGVVQFYTLRICLATVSTLCEYYFIRAVMRHVGAKLGIMFWCASITSCGMFISATAFLPSTFAMYCTMLAFGGWMNDNHMLAVGAIATTALVGWPFSAILGLPIALDLLLVQRKVGVFMSRALLSFVTIAGFTVAMDYYYYNKFILASLNIVLYNVFGKGGPDLYGTESWSFYFLNGALNFNILFAITLVALPMALGKMLSMLVQHQRISRSDRFSLGIVLALVVWFAVFMTRPHKEERFLFPVYPLIIFASGFGMITSLEVLKFCNRSLYRYFKGGLGPAMFATVFVHAVVSLSRSVALYHGYHAPLDIYSNLKHIHNNLLPHGQTVNLCVGKEWYRFPSSFFLPSQDWNLFFLKSEFRGQLPKYFEAPPPEGSRVIPASMNDMNLEEISRYVDISECDFLIDLDNFRLTKLEPKYSVDSRWKTLISLPFLDAPRSHRFFRAFYVPLVSRRLVNYSLYTLFERKHA